MQNAYQTITEFAARTSLSKGNQSQNASTCLSVFCAFLAGFSECFGIHLHEDKRKALRKLKKNLARQNQGKDFLTQNYYWQSWKQLKTTFTFQLLSIKQHLDNSASLF